jgi:hypothetical protein
MPYFIRVSGPTPTDGAGNYRSDFQHVNGSYGIEPKGSTDEVHTPPLAGAQTNFCGCHLLDLMTDLHGGL